jgi:hypothetical protein
MNKHRLGLALVSILFFASVTMSCTKNEHSPQIVSKYNPQDGYVPDEITAVAVAEAVCVPFYGHDLVEAEKPYSAVLKGDLWTVRGTLPKGDQRMGGTLTVQISKRDGRIVSMTHGQ